MASVENVPIGKADRAEILDILRGFALLGICMANAASLSMYVFQPPNLVASLPFAATDKWLKYFHYMFIDGKFYSLFSLLFGIGFAIIFFRKHPSEKAGLIFFYRRLFFLMIFGLAHSLFLWDGDILFFYGIVGIFLPLFRKCNDRTLLILFVILWLSPLIFDAIKVLTDNKLNISNPVLQTALQSDKKFGITEQNVSGWLIVNDTYQDLVNWSRSGFWWGWQMRLDSNRIPKVLGMFLLGLYLGRSKFYEHLKENSSLLMKIQFWTFLIGLPSGVAYSYFVNDNERIPSSTGLLDSLFYVMNVASLSLAYASAFALWYLQTTTQKWLLWLQPVGRMALTNYIVQSAFGVLIYYGIGFGLGGSVGPSIFIPIAVGIFLVQVLYSHIWLHYFNYGPLEWLWRQLTYGKPLPLLKK